MRARRCTNGYVFLLIKIADFVPEGWMNSTNVSREYGTLKKRRDRDALMELDEM